MHSVAAVVNEGCLTFDLAVPCEVFGWDRSYLGVDWYDFKVVAADPPPVRTSTGFTIDTPYGLDDLVTADTIVVPGWSDVEVAPSPELVDALRAAYDRGARLMSIGHGGQTLLSSTTAGLVRDQLPSGVSLRDLGEHRLKDLIRPERVFQVTVPGLPSGGARRVGGLPRVRIARRPLLARPN